jgi:hypothetical protein
MKPKPDPGGLRQSTLTLEARRGTTIRERFHYRRPTARYIAAAAVIVPSLQEYRPTLAIVNGITEAMTCTAWSPPQPTIGMVQGGERRQPALACGRW